jgi:hypothetical protein
VVAEIANISPIERKVADLSELYYRFLKDPTSSKEYLY